MVEIDNKIPQFVYFPKTQNTTGIYTLHLHSELSQKDWTFDVTDQANLKDYYKFYVDFSSVDDGEFNYHICEKDSSTELDTGLIRIGVVKNYGNKSYDDDVQIIQYDMYATPEIRYQHKSITAATNGVYNITPDDGYAALSEVDVTVNVDCDDAYQDGVADGKAEQKALLTSTAITQNGTYTRENGWNEIEVNVNTVHNQEKRIGIKIPDDVDLYFYKNITPDSGYTGLSNVIFSIAPTGFVTVPIGYNGPTEEYNAVKEYVYFTVTNTDTNYSYTVKNTDMSSHTFYLFPGYHYEISFNNINGYSTPSPANFYGAWNEKYYGIYYRYVPIQPSTTGITVDSLSWGATNIPATGGTADASDCTFTVTAHNSDNTTTDITSAATVTGSLIVPASTATTIHPAGTLTLTFAYDGYTATASTTVYQDAAVEPVPPTPSGYTNIPVGFEITGDGVINWRCDTASNSKTIEYSKNGGAWISIASTSTGTPISVVAGDVVRFRGNNESYGPPSGDINNTFSGSTAQFSVNGNIMSLINSTDFANLTTLTSMYTFKGLFCFCTGLTDASNLVLPATTLTADCYYRMFNGCTNLTGAPVLPARTLTYNCYRMMFGNCSSLTTAPQLPATTLSGNCYNEMFINCTSLETAPELPATELVQSCYYGMFWGCTNLNYIKCLATDNSANNCTYNWVNSVAANGTFVKAAGTTWSTGNNGIPANWDVVNN